ncbi:uncharacterized protein MONOS_3227 [Monocercomonoides exilis]|uniref:uncharacterized protein n=1 Tax=Monocercomonoides exilis TaxID=2049356 RepID=UPI003559A59D|nr:hypothetical protein MONOS_3227 [Monocercomonoides exilis]|eukprot:MONOS_3227.1-p1 / transcript=MONOS_3227.1 / gene=MONOS_3227 / organism=Monocercomonoides_exilis_PA203 / gene_product=unspecified product / transcript_product=unspecified product / location=Mono_scaffold00074:94553-95331(-) / protein_length=197 / sequence_SO=supercontig / SO=protein_coding / is_pseudo=false
MQTESGTIYTYARPWVKFAIPDAMLTTDAAPRACGKHNARRILLRSDNIAVAYDINRWTAGKNLLSLLMKIRQTTTERNIQLKAIYLPGAKNTTADAFSRIQRTGDYEIIDEALRELEKRLSLTIEQKHDVGRRASSGLDHSDHSGSLSRSSDSSILQEDLGRTSESSDSASSMEEPDLDLAASGDVNTLRKTKQF